MATAAGRREVTSEVGQRRSDRHGPPARATVSSRGMHAVDAGGQAIEWLAGQFRIHQWLLLRVLLVAVDAVAIWGGLTLAYRLRFTSGLLQYHAAWSAEVYGTLTLICVPLWLLWGGVIGLYRRDTLLGGLGEYKLVLDACTGGVMQLVLVSFLWRELGMISRGWILLAWLSSCLAMGTGRFVVRRIGYQLRRQGWFRDRVLIVGASEQGAAIAEQWLHSRRSGMELAGFLDDFKPVGTPVVDGLQVLGRPSALPAIAHQLGANEVVVVAGATSWETFEELVVHAVHRNGYTLRMSPGFYETLTTGMAVANKTFVPLYSVNSSRLVGLEAMVKTMLDYGLGLPALVLTAPLMVGIGLALRFDGTGKAALQRHTVLGRGRRFVMLKFRSAGPTDVGSATAFESLLYRTGLDKLPQLLDVITGCMSLVGPRPRVLGKEGDPPDTVRNLTTVKPGLVGPWLVRSHWSTGNEARDDLYYVRNWTIWLDLQIIIQVTASLVLRGRTAGAGEAEPSIDISAPERSGDGGDTQRTA